MLTTMKEQERGATTMMITQVTSEVITEDAG
jgi:hypothetical protein